MSGEVVEGRLGGGLPYLSFGHGPALVVFPGLGTINANPTGIQRWGELRLLSPLARSFTVHRIGRKVGLKRGTTMPDLARDCAEAIGAGFDAPVDVLGISTGYLSRCSSPSTGRTWLEGSSWPARPTASATTAGGSSGGSPSSPPRATVAGSPA